MAIDTILLIVLLVLNLLFCAITTIEMQIFNRWLKSESTEEQEND